MVTRTSTPTPRRRRWASRSASPCGWWSPPRPGGCACCRRPVPGRRRVGRGRAGDRGGLERPGRAHGDRAARRPGGGRPGPRRRAGGARASRSSGWTRRPAGPRPQRRGAGHERRPVRAHLRRGLVPARARGARTRSSSRWWTPPTSGSRNGPASAHAGSPSDGETTASLGAEAAAGRSRAPAWDPEAVDLVIVATITPERLMPSTAAYVQQRLGMHCAGLRHERRVRRVRLRAQRRRRADHRRRRRPRPGGRRGDALADARHGGPHDLRPVRRRRRAPCSWSGPTSRASSTRPLELDGTATELLTIHAGGSEEPASEETVRNGRHALRMTDGRAVFKRAAVGMAEACAHLLEKTGMTADDVSVVIPHQANARIMLAVGGPPERAARARCSWTSRRSGTPPRPPSRSRWTTRGAGGCPPGRRRADDGVRRRARVGRQHHQVDRARRPPTGRANDRRPRRVGHRRPRAASVARRAFASRGPAGRGGRLPLRPRERRGGRAEDRVGRRPRAGRRRRRDRRGLGGRRPSTQVEPSSARSPCW